jgi:hypothetical protein
MMTSNYEGNRLWLKDNCLFVVLADDDNNFLKGIIFDIDKKMHWDVNEPAALLLRSLQERKDNQNRVMQHEEPGLVEGLSYGALKAKYIKEYVLPAGGEAAALQEIDALLDQLKLAKLIEMHPAPAEVIPVLPGNRRKTDNPKIFPGRTLLTMGRVNLVKGVY